MYGTGDPAGWTEKEAGRVISSSPRREPGRQRDRAVNVTYTFPVIFKLRGARRLRTPLPHRPTLRTMAAPTAVRKKAHFTHGSPVLGAAVRRMGVFGDKDNDLIDCGGRGPQK